MRILFVIPHYFGAGSSSYGSSDISKKQQRVASMRACIASLHQQFGHNQYLQQYNGSKRPINGMATSSIDVVVCVRGEDHLLENLDMPQGSFRTHVVDMGDPRYLGYACYDVFRDSFGSYDWYCFLEDDIVVNDPLFFCKLQIFYNATGDARYLLQPNRFELGITPKPYKIYIDGPIWEDSASFLAKMRQPGCRDEIVLPFGTQSFRMIPAVNPHSGCFFLTEAHLGHLLEQPWYGEHIVGYAGPLESAATLYLMALFHVFKPADECANFLEVHHYYQKHVTG